MKISFSRTCLIQLSVPALLFLYYTSCSQSPSMRSAGSIEPSLKKQHQGGFCGSQTAPDYEDGLRDGTISSEQVLALAPNMPEDSVLRRLLPATGDPSEAGGLIFAAQEGGIYILYFRYSDSGQPEYRFALQAPKSGRDELLLPAGTSDSKAAPRNTAANPTSATTPLQRNGSVTREVVQNLPWGQDAEVAWRSCGVERAPENSPYGFLIRATEGGRYLLVPGLWGELIYVFYYPAGGGQYPRGLSRVVLLPH